MSIKQKLIYLVLFILTIPSYIYARSILLNQDTFYTTHIGGFTMNMLLLMFLWGVYSEKTWKGKKGWIIFALGLGVIMTVLSLAGVETRF